MEMTKDCDSFHRLTKAIGVATAQCRLLWGTRRWIPHGWWVLVTFSPLLFAQANDISLVGLSEGKIVVEGPDGRAKIFRSGEMLPNGARLISANAEAAVIEIGGKRSTLTMGGRITLAGPSASPSRVTLTADAQGHFETLGTIDGASVRFLVDTGATMSSMSTAEARRIGINYLKGEPGYASTANGSVKVYHVRLGTVKVGDISITGVDALIHESDIPFVLLGMTFLNRVEMSRRGDTLTLIRRY